MEQSTGELIACVDETGEITGEFVDRKEFYAGKCPDKNICGIVFWIFDKEGNVLLTERGAEKEQGAGKIAPPSGHVRYRREDGTKERPIQGCFREIQEELGLTWNYKNFPLTDDYYPVGVIEKPKGSAESCKMIVKNYALLLGDGVKEQIRNNENKRIFFEPWDTVAPKFGADDKTPGEYQFWGTNKEEVLYELDGFVFKIKNLDRLGQDATWDTIALNDIDDIEQFRQNTGLRPENREGYVTWVIASMREDLTYYTEVESTIFDTITVKKDVSFEDIEDIFRMTAKDIRITIEEVRKINGEKAKEHTAGEFSEIIVPQSEVNNAVNMIRMVMQRGDKTIEKGYTQGE